MAALYTQAEAAWLEAALIVVTARQDLQQDRAALGRLAQRAVIPDPAVARVAQPERLDLHLEAGRLQLLGGLVHRHADGVRHVDLSRPGRHVDGQRLALLVDRAGL